MTLAEVSVLYSKQPRIGALIAPSLPLAQPFHLAGLEESTKHGTLSGSPGVQPDRVWGSAKVVESRRDGHEEGRHTGYTNSIGAGRKPPACSCRRLPQGADPLGTWSR